MSAARSAKQANERVMRANEQTDERVAQCLRLDFCWFWSIMQSWHQIERSWPGPTQRLNASFSNLYPPCPLMPSFLGGGHWKKRKKNNDRRGRTKKWHYYCKSVSKNTIPGASPALLRGVFFFFFDFRCIRSKILFPWFRIDHSVGSCFKHCHIAILNFMFIYRVSVLYVMSWTLLPWKCDTIEAVGGMSGGVPRSRLKIWHDNRLARVGEDFEWSSRRRRRHKMSQSGTKMELDGELV